MQTKLTDEQIENVRHARELLRLSFKTFLWNRTKAGHEFWSQVSQDLLEIIEHGTSDGKPWIEPEPPPLPELTDEFVLKFVEKTGRRPMVEVRDHDSADWLGPRELIGVKCERFNFATMDTQHRVILTWACARLTPADAAIVRAWGESP